MIDTLPSRAARRTQVMDERNINVFATGKTWAANLGKPRERISADAFAKYKRLLTTIVKVWVANPRGPEIE